MTSEEFWASTPRQFSSLTERYRERAKREDRRAGGVMAMLYNINRDPEKDPKGLDWQDFFSEWKEETEQTEDEMLTTMMLWNKSTEGLSH